jgi:hypothetical protein
MTFVSASRAVAVFTGIFIWFALPAAKADLLAETVEGVIAPQPRSRLYEEWEKLRVKVDGRILNDQAPMGRVGSIGADLRYRYLVQPAFIQSYHQRFDSYMVRLNAGISREIGFGVALEGQVSFSRLYPTKQDALTAPIYFLNRFPFKSSVALSALNPGDAVRLEIGSDGSIGKGFSSVFSQFQVAASLAYNRGTRFVVDVYRMQENRVRIRVIGTRNMGSVSSGVAVDPVASIDVGLGFINNILRRWLHCTPASIGASGSLGNGSPVDTVMVDYVFDLSKPQGAAAYEAVMMAIRKIQLQIHLNFLGDQDKLAAEVLRYLSVAEGQYQRDRGKSFAARSVDRVFKGRSLTRFASSSLGSDCLRIWDASISAYYSTTGVRSYDKNDVASDNLYVSTSVGSKREFFLGLYGEEGRVAANALFPAEKRPGGTIGGLHPTSLSDVIVSREIKDKVLKPSEVRRFIRDFQYQYPLFDSMVDWRPLQSADTKVNAYARLKFALRAEAFAGLPKLGFGELRARLERYVNMHPDVARLPFTPGQHSDAHWYDYRFEEDFSTIAQALHTLINSNDVMSRFKAFSEIRHNRLFQSVGVGFVMSLLPKERIDELVRFSLTAGADQMEPMSVTNSAPGPSSVYLALEYILATINERGFDLRLQLDESGTLMSVVGPKNHDVTCVVCL